MVSTIVHSQVNDLMNNPQFKEVESSKKENSNFAENNYDHSMKKNNLKNKEEADKNEKNVHILSKFKKEI